MSPAPELAGDTWFAVDQPSLSIGDFRGRFVLLDFWTMCCVNCHHVLAELRAVEEKYADVLTVVGVHSPKFEHEKDPAAVARAIERHDISHPVLNDPDMTTWQAYGVRAWPTLVLVDPEGEVCATYSGEGHAHAIDALISSLLEDFELRGTLVRGLGRYRPVERSEGVFRQPGKISVVPPAYRHWLGGADLMVSDSGGHLLAAVSHQDPQTVVWGAGSGRRGRDDGPLDAASFSEPYGVSFLSPEHAHALGYHLVVADTANHLIRAINLETGQVITVAGTGRQWMQQDPTSGPAEDVSITTPWDVLVDGDQCLIAMAGDHRIWSLSLADATLNLWAGTSNEGLVDGEASSAWFAQPSGLAGDSRRLWLVDAETSALRTVTDGQVQTLIGRGLFDFGHVDGIGSEALLQHPLGLALLPDGSIALADSYNGSIRRYSPETNMVTTLRRGLAEPSDLAVVDTESGVFLAVVETGANTVSICSLPEGTLHRGESFATARPPISVAPGEVTVEVVFQPPPGQKQDERYGPSTQLIVSATPASMLSSGSGSSTELVRTITIAAQATSGVLHVQAKGASCEHGELAACHIHQQDWGIPVTVEAGGDNRVSLLLSGALAQSVGWPGATVTPPLGPRICLAGPVPLARSGSIEGRRDDR